MSEKNLSVNETAEVYGTKVVAGEEIMDVAEKNALGFTVKSVSTGSKGRRSLNGTAALQAVAAGIATDVFNKVQAESNAKELVANSAETHYNMDRLVMTFTDLSEVNISFLLELSDPEIAAMQKSQASKRSRCKSAEMTMENYMNMMNACVCELLIRRVTGKEKGIRTGGGSRGTRTTLVYREDQIVALEGNREAILREIRNLASKKSIYKNSEQFDEESERWSDILEAEGQLKALRDELPATARAPRTNKLQTQLMSLFSENEPESMTKAQLLEFVNKIRDVLVPVAEEHVLDMVGDADVPDEEADAEY